MSRPGRPGWVGLRFGTAGGLALLPLLWCPAAPAAAAQACPARLGSFVLSRGVGLSFRSEDPEPRHGSGISCHYAREYDGGFEPMETASYDLTVEWRSENTDVETYYCAGGSFARRAATRGPADGSYSEDFPTTRRRVVGSLSLVDPDGQGGALPVAEARQVLRSMMDSASALAAPCPDVGAAAGSGERTGTASAPAPATAGVTPAPEPAEVSETNRMRVGGLLAGAGAAVSVVAGAGSVAARRRRPTVTGATAVQPTQRLYSGSEAVELLRRAGLITEVPGGYRAQGALRHFFPQAPTHYPELPAPLQTPGGGRATHLVGLACHEGGDGVLSHLQVVVLEDPPPGPGPVAAGQLPSGTAGATGAGSGPGGGGTGTGSGSGYDPIGGLGGRPQPGGPPTPPAPPVPPVPPVPPAPPVQGDPPVPLVQGVPPVPPVAPAPPPPAPTGRPDASAPRTPPPPHPPEEPSGPASSSEAGRPPADPERLREWLTSAGDKRITPGDLHTLRPDLIGPDGAIGRGPYAGSIPGVRFDGDTFTVSVPAPPNAPIYAFDLEVSGSLTAENGRLVAHLPGAGDLVTGMVQGQLDEFARGWHDAGLRIDHVRVEDGGLRFSVSPP